MTSRIYPVTFVWKEADVVDGETGEATRMLVMVPLNAANAAQARRQFHIGEEYPLAPLEARSRASHSAYFAQLHEYWQNLPEKVSARWLNEDHFRKWCLIECGWYDESEIDCASSMHATRLSGMVKSFDAFARIHVRGNVVIVRRAKSQSAAAMSKEPFEKSKNDVLDLAAQFVGVSPAQMRKHAGRNA